MPDGIGILSRKVLLQDPDGRSRVRRGSGDLGRGIPCDSAAVSRQETPWTSRHLLADPAVCFSSNSDTVKVNGKPLLCPPDLMQTRSEASGLRFETADSLGEWGSSVPRISGLQGGKAKLWELYSI